MRRPVFIAGALFFAAACSGQASKQPSREEWARLNQAQFDL